MCAICEGQFGGFILTLTHCPSALSPPPPSRCRLQHTVGMDAQEGRTICLGCALLQLKSPLFKAWESWAFFFRKNHQHDIKSLGKYNYEEYLSCNYVYSVYIYIQLSRITLPSSMRLPLTWCSGPGILSLEGPRDKEGGQRQQGW